MNYTSIYYDYIPQTIEYGVELTYTGIRWIFQFIIMLIVVMLRSETPPHLSVRMITTLLTIVYYMVDSGRTISLWGWRHVRNLLHNGRYTDHMNDDDTDITSDDLLNSISLPIHFTKEHFELLKAAKRDLECPICYRTMDSQTFRIFRQCCHICCIRCIENLQSHRCPYCKTIL